jgi:hypothetical protein
MKYILFVLFSVFSSTAYSQEYFLPESKYIKYNDEGFSFKNNEIEHWMIINYHKPPFERTIKGVYYLEIIDNVTFINIQWENNQKEKYLILYNNIICLLYKNDGDVYFRGFKIRGGAPGELCSSVNNSELEITATSHLIEGNIIYSTAKLNYRTGECWAEGVNGQGINETLYIKLARANTIHISIGFVSFNKPYLFNQNSRPRKIELSVENKYRIIINLENTPNIQTINLPEELGRNEILELKILDVYHGIKYDDTCINMILVDRSKY